MIKSKSTAHALLRPLADGQMWRMAEAVLQVTQMGKLLVHYKLGKPDAIRVSNSIGSISSIEKYLKKNKAVLLRAKPLVAKTKRPSKANGAAKKPAAKK